MCYFLYLGDGSTIQDIPRLLDQCFGALIHACIDDTVRSSVALELYSKELISNEIKNEATRVAGDPEQKAFILVKELFSLCTTFKSKLLTIARAISELPSVNSIGGMMEALFWRMVMFGMLYYSFKLHNTNIKCRHMNLQICRRGCEVVFPQLRLKDQSLNVLLSLTVRGQSHPLRRNQWPLILIVVRFIIMKRIQILNLCNFTNLCDDPLLQCLVW